MIEKTVKDNKEISLYPFSHYPGLPSLYLFKTHCQVSEVQLGMKDGSILYLVCQGGFHVSVQQCNC